MAIGDSVPVDGQDIHSNLSHQSFGLVIYICHVGPDLRHARDVRRVAERTDHKGAPTARG
jgi:hypothetical protein